MNRDYQIISKKNSRELAKFLSTEGQLLLPMLELIEQAEAAVDEVIDVVGRASIEAILLLSAQQVAGPQHKGKNTGNIRWHGKQKNYSCQTKCHLVHRYIPSQLIVCESKFPIVNSVEPDPFFSVLRMFRGTGTFKSLTVPSSLSLQASGMKFSGA